MSGEKVLRLPPQFNVDPRGGLVGALKELLGPPPSRGEWSARTPPGRSSVQSRALLVVRAGTCAHSGHVRGSASPRAARIAGRGARPCPRGPGRQGESDAREHETVMAIEIEVATKDCTALSDAELAEMADLCASWAERLGSGVPVQAARGVGARHPGSASSRSCGAMRSQPSSGIGGTPVLLVGVATVHRTARAERRSRPRCATSTVGQCSAFPDEDVLVGTRLLGRLRVPCLLGLTTSSPARPQGHRRGACLGPPAGQAVRRRRPARRQDVRGRRGTVRRRAFDFDPQEQRGENEALSNCSTRWTPASRQPGGLRLGHGRGAGGEHAARLRHSRTSHRGRSWSRQDQGRGSTPSTSLGDCPRCGAPRATTRIPRDPADRRHDIVGAHSAVPGAVFASRSRSSTTGRRCLRPPRLK